MHQPLAFRRQAAQQMSVTVAQKQHYLKEQQAGGPNSGRTAEPREDLLGEDRLNLEDRNELQKIVAPNSVRSEMASRQRAGMAAVLANTPFSQRSTGQPVNCLGRLPYTQLGLFNPDGGHVRHQREKCKIFVEEEAHFVL